ncbi:GntR family transcriptional regulator [Marinicauda pacifica]|uniref:UTRA domain-containing protein n=1 Tax=Marinicauda pacifica TaxID=1133559 RepID=A0A4S2HF65_9PROT|nr:GntR family transcriptional regulator [Marinicauda pacifica]TGY94734.1 UTRA domain-containing protein [Marinicauda pacifica]GGE38364.1 GntR family transcriptional regulator [Marinicauda pacifica]
MTETLDTRSWRGVHVELLRRIQTKEWLPGAPIPNEADLAIEFGCARTTVNRAMRELAEAGLIDRKRRAGTRVALNPVSRVVLDIPIIRLEVEQRNASWRYTLLERAVCPAPVAISSRLGLDRETAMLHLSGLHFADNKPFLHEDRWINLSAVPGVERVDFSAISANEWLLQNARFTHGDITFSAEVAGESRAGLLSADPAAAIFVVDRITWDQGQAITSVRLSYAPGYDLHSKI